MHNSMEFPSVHVFLLQIEIPFFRLSKSKYFCYLKVFLEQEKF